MWRDDLRCEMLAMEDIQFASGGKGVWLFLVGKLWQCEAKA